jgi:hypothetical protein
MTPKLAILGTCVSADWVHFQHPSRQLDVRVLPYQPSSVISMMADPIDIAIDSGDLKERDTVRLKVDFDKSFLRSLIESKPNFLIVEVLADSRRGVIPIGNSWVSRTSRLERSPMRDRISSQRFTAVNNPEAYYSLFRQSAAKLFHFLQEHLPGCQIILNHARWAEYYVDDDGELQSYKAKLQNEYFVSNLRLQDLERIFGEEVPCKHLVVDDVPTFADSRHIWGVGPEHYIKAHYASFIEELRTLLQG